MEIGLISETRAALNVRVVSGTPGHLPPHTIKATDDVVIATLQTMARAVQNKQQLPGLKAWLKGAENLVIVFDEAHHSPAPSYRELLQQLRKLHPKMLLMGLTATPTYGDENKRGWLEKLFPQGILHEVSARRLMLDGILAKPIFETHETEIKPEWNEREYQKWLGTYADLPENIITHLAENKQRNKLIAQTYVENQKKYGKTIIFAERWHQCEYIREFLIKKGIKAGAIYTQVERGASTAAGRNKRDKNANQRELEAFRRGDLDVLINVRMLTEGTDVPDVQSVFITRQTTSQILLTQMVGRALRGPKFGGTETANIVAFHDIWQNASNFAGPGDKWGGGGTEEDPKTTKQYAPLQLISIEMVRQLARDMDRGVTQTSGPFLSLMPSGWYATTFDARVKDNEDEVVVVRDLILVFDRDQDAYEKFIAHLKTQKLPEFGDESVTMEDVSAKLEQWHQKFFALDSALVVPQRLRNLLDIARHMAQRAGSGAEIAPPFIAFEARQDHDLDGLALSYIEADLGPNKIKASLQHEFERGDRLWKVIYPNFDTFKSQLDACINSILMPGNAREFSPVDIGGIENESEREPSDEVKRQVKDRDGWRCLCCGENQKKLLESDHIVSWYSSGNNHISNLQTLCRVCNSRKNINEMNFRLNSNDAIHNAPESLPEFSLSEVSDVRDAAQWERYLRRELNQFYGCAAVHSVTIGKRGTSFYEWEIELWQGNDPQWLKPHLKKLRDDIRGYIQANRSDDCVMEQLIVKAPNAKILASPVHSRQKSK